MSDYQMSQEERDWMDAPGGPIRKDAFIGGKLIPGRALQMADEAYRSGQPFMDGLILALLKNGANTPEQNAHWLRVGMIDESLKSPMLRDHEREHIWHTYHVPRWKRVVYRLRVRAIGYRVRS